MDTTSLKDKIITQSIDDTKWLVEAKQRQHDSDWLDISFQIALTILRYLRKNKISQKSIAEKMKCSPQYLSKILKGKENLTLETICKLQKILGISLITAQPLMLEVDTVFETVNTYYSFSAQKKVLVAEFEEIYLNDKEFIAENNSTPYSLAS